MKKYYYFIVLTILLLTLSCSGGGGGGGSSSGSGSTDSTPMISNLTVYPSSAPLNDGGGSITLTLTYNFIDMGGDLSTSTFVLYYPDGTTKTFTPRSLASLNGITSGQITEPVNTTTQTRGTATFGIYVTDSGGRQSNQLKGTFTVY
jgi:hypothetical protein